MQHVTVLQIFAHQTLLLALSETSSPFFAVILFSLQILDFICGLIDSVKFLMKHCVPSLRHAKKKITNWKLRVFQCSAPPTAETSESWRKDIDKMIPMDNFNLDTLSRRPIWRFSSAQCVRNSDSGYTSITFYCSVSSSFIIISLLWHYRNVWRNL